MRYSASRTEQGYPRAYRLFGDAGGRLDYPGFLELWSEVSEEFDRESAETLREFSMLELTHAFLHRAVGKAPEPERVARFVEAYLREWNQGVAYLDGIERLLGRLARSYTLAVVTNTHDPLLVPNHLEAMGVLDRFESVLTSVEFGLRKPHPAIFAQAVDALGAREEACLYVGDDLDADYHGARGAGLHALLIDPGAGAPVAERDRIGSVFELEARLAEADGAPGR